MMPGGFEWLLLMGIVLGFFALFIYALVDILKSEFENSINKVIWLLLIIFMGPIGVVLYLIIGKKQKVKKV
ncbi:MAG: PLDc N-terminal domain-containing protein [Aliarcobacter sp.]|nr:PLDc N-terminal domain-containing protein [Aliarcobacter sp.]MDD2887782.1 PLDc N-terminal domain-containing protein [Aliarcobacter sp.]